MSLAAGWVRRYLAAMIAIAVLAGMFSAARLPTVSGAETAQLASGFAFTPVAIEIPGGYRTQTVRRVNPDYQHIEAWISSVGAGIAMNDLDGDGLANDLCLTDPRIDQAVVTPAPVAGARRYQPFVLDPAPLPVDRTMAPVGCVPGDFNADGRIDLLVYYMGRTPIIFLARAGTAGAHATALAPAAYHPVELVDAGSRPGSYRGPLWQTTAVVVADLDGDGQEDLFLGNYFPHGPVLDETAAGGVAMNRSMSNAFNGGESYLYRWTGAAAGPEPTVSYQRVPDALPAEVATGWVLAAGATDLDGDLLPELYLAHDFGPDRLLYNRSTPGNIALSLVEGVRRPLVPKSKHVGHDSFKGMGVDFGDLDGDGLYDLFVSNITTSFGIHESNFAYVSTARDRDGLRQRLRRGEAPFEDRSAPLGLAWSGWGWDAKLADLDNDGDLEVVQTTGFVKGKVNRWPQLQELASANDDLLADPGWWPNVREGDDIAGHQHLRFFARGGGGRYVDLSDALGLAVPVPTRGIALGDADGDGRLELAVARQWDAPVFYRNDSPSPGEFLGLRLAHPNGSPVTGAQATVTTPDGRTLLGRVDGGSGHSGKRSHEVVIGLGDVDGPVTAELRWRDRAGRVHAQRLRLAPGWHHLQLDAQAREVT